ncbi:hypothetical protein [Dysgonomonas termitidis]|uniref:ArnR1-like winged helix-turn-helix domain-containing protein n=1 Tax=Dysgonomonas termitidis TaxID=1516126 RepID=A0ABV9KTW4_9BACT
MELGINKETENEIIQEILSKMRKNIGRYEPRLIIKNYLGTDLDFKTLSKISRSITSRMVEEGLIEGGHGTYTLTQKGIKIANDGDDGYKKYLQEQKEKDQLREESEIAEYKKKIFDYKFRYISYFFSLIGDMIKSTFK